jgi:hypothetical protein
MGYHLNTVYFLAYMHDKHTHREIVYINQLSE